MYILTILFNMGNIIIIIIVVYSVLSILQIITCILLHYRVFNSMLINIEIFLIYKSLVLKRNKHILLYFTPAQ